MKTCITCGKDFKQHQIINGVKRSLKHRQSCTDCVPLREPVREKVNTICHACKKPITKTQREIEKSKTGRVFCSPSCAAKTNNKNQIKRPRTKKCRTCDNLITSGFTFCKGCWEKQLIDLSSLTLLCCIEKDHHNKYSIIKNHAREITKNKEQKCSKCGYDKHVETCHIKEISSFSLDTLVTEINHPDNLLLLCPNCHWTMDHPNLTVGG